MAASAQAQAEATKEAQKAGIEHAKGAGACLGRKPSLTAEQLANVGDMLAGETAISTIAKSTGLGRGCSGELELRVSKEGPTNSATVYERGAMKSSQQALSPLVCSSVVSASS